VHTLFSYQGIISVIRIVCVSSSCTSSVAHNPEIKFQEFCKCERCVASMVSQRTMAEATSMTAIVPDVERLIDLRHCYRAVEELSD